MCEDIGDEEDDACSNGSREERIEVKLALIKAKKPSSSSGELFEMRREARKDMKALAGSLKKDKKQGSAEEEKDETAEETGRTRFFGDGRRRQQLEAVRHVVGRWDMCLRRVMVL